MVVFSADQERNGRLVETSALPVPLLDRIERTLSSEVEHEKYGDSVIANEG